MEFRVIQKDEDLQDPYVGWWAKRARKMRRMRGQHETNEEEHNRPSRRTTRGWFKFYLGGKRS